MRKEWSLVMRSTNRWKSLRRKMTQRRGRLWWSRHGEICPTRRQGIGNNYGRIVNLELMKMYGETQWKERVEQLESWLQQTEMTNKRIKEENEKCNQRRKFKQQEQLGPQLTQVKTQIADQVVKNRKLEKVCLEMEEELLQRDALEKKKVRRINSREQTEFTYDLKQVSHF